ncbi:MAG: hypothetical protein MZV64_23000 [Ignavibacteriales bacterium]|nr:hypothetical protein [Ignavibacteriales bacterium]
MGREHAGTGTCSIMQRDSLTCARKIPPCGAGALTSALRMRQTVRTPAPRTLGDKTVVVAVNVSGSRQQINVTYEAGKESRGRSLAKRLISRWTGACISPSQPTAAWC